MGFEGFPLIVGWELTLRCNFSCRHCGSSAGRPRISELTTEEALSICDQFPDLLVQEVDFTGGEPLMRDDWSVVAAHLMKKKIQVNILTNGWSMDDGRAAELKDLGISCVGISLDGIEKTHDCVRGRPGSFKAVISALESMQRHDLPFNLITTVNAFNIVELPELLSLVLSMGVRFWRLQTVIPFGRVKEFRELQVGPDEIRALGSFIRSNSASAAKRGLKIICSDGLMYIEDPVENSKPWRGCPAGIVACGITSDGRVKGCLSMSDELIEGDLRTVSLWDLWFRPDAFAYNRSFDLSRLGDNCASCAKASDCMGGCTANSYAATGKFHNDPYCHYAITTGLNARASEHEAEPPQPVESETNRSHPV